MEVDWGGNPRFNSWKRNTNHNYSSSGLLLIGVDWGGKLKLNYTSSGCMLIKVDWGGKLRANSVVDWGAHETHPNAHSITEVDSRCHDVFLFLVLNIDYDAQAKRILHSRIVGRPTTK